MRNNPYLRSSYQRRLFYALWVGGKTLWCMSPEILLIYGYFRNSISRVFLLGTGMVKNSLTVDSTVDGLEAYLGLGQISLFMFANTGVFYHTHIGLMI